LLTEERGGCGFCQPTCQQVGRIQMRTRTAAASQLQLQAENCEMQKSRQLKKGTKKKAKWRDGESAPRQTHKKNENKVTLTVGKCRINQEVEPKRCKQYC